MDSHDAGTGKLEKLHPEERQIAGLGKISWPMNRSYRIQEKILKCMDAARSRSEESTIKFATGQSDEATTVNDKYDMEGHYAVMLMADNYRNHLKDWNKCIE